MRTMSADILLRPAIDDDLRDIAAIYNHEIANSIATFDLEPPTLAYWQEKLRASHPGDHLLVAVDHDQDVVGYAHLWSYRPDCADPSSGSATREPLRRPTWPAATATRAGDLLTAL